MFYRAAFNQAIPTDGDKWDVSKVTTMSAMFNGAAAFNNGGVDGIKAWKTGLVTSMQAMFREAAAFNQPITKNGDKWDTTKVTTMTDMFNGARAFDQDIFNWKVGSVTNNLRMFTNSGLTPSSLLNRQPCSIPATASATLNWPKCPFCPDFGAQFADKTKLKAAVDACVGKVASGVGCCAAGADCGVAGTGAGATEMLCWDVSLVTDMADLFKDKAQFNADISYWKTGLVTTMKGMFHGAAAFNQAIPTDGDKWDTAKVADMQSMFEGASAFNKDIGTWDVSKVTNMQGMFNGAAAFNNGGADGIKAWKTGLVTSMRKMFL